MMLSLRAALELWDGRPDEALMLAIDARDGFRAIGERYGEVQSLSPLSRALVAKGRLADANKVTEECQRAAGQFGLDVFAYAIAAGVAAHSGNGERAVLNARMALDDPTHRFEFETDVRVALSLGLLQTGRVSDALEQLDQAGLDHPQTPYSAGALALVLAAGGRPDAALVAANTVATAPGATYLDLVTAACATTLALAQRGDDAEARAALLQTAELADRSGDLVAQAMARLAGAEALAALGDPDVDAARADAQERASRFDGCLAGWSTAFALAARGSDSREAAAVP
jgi:ATP/maltotriose-dependent transcriptional regulator MalT